MPTTHMASVIVELLHYADVRLANNNNNDKARREAAAAYGWRDDQIDGS